MFRNVYCFRTFRWKYQYFRGECVISMLKKNNTILEYKFKA